jgi:hypothetical protein
MRRSVGLGLGFSVAAAVLIAGRALDRQARFRIAARAAATTGVEAVAPIAQDAAAIEKRRRDRLEWNRRTLGGAYDKVGRKDPRWDGPAREAMERAARLFSEEVDPVTTPGDVYKPAKAAVDAGCDDPLVRYLHIRFEVGPERAGVAEAIRRRGEIAKALAASRYPAYRRMAALKLDAGYMLSLENPGDEVKKEAERKLDAALALLDESAADDGRDEFWELGWLGSLAELIRGYRTLGLTGPEAYQRVDARLARLPELKVLRLLVRGHFWHRYGWEARTNAFAVAVPAGGFETLGKCSEIAREAYEEAWRLRPDISETATGLLEIDKGVGGDRATMELWFDRAMKADGDNRTACWSKLDWLAPKWHGSNEEMLAFGRACRDTKNWRTGITLLVADAHWRIACRLGGMEQPKYMALPEVWADIKPVYVQYLEHHPNDDVARTKYATFAYLGGHFREAHAQYEALGDRLAQWSESPYVPLGDLKRNRKHAEEILMGNPSPIGLPGWHFVGGKNDDGHWRVNVPVAATRKQEAGILGAKSRNVWTCTADGVSYAIRVQGVPPTIRKEGPARVLDAARAAVAEERGGQTRDVRDTKLANRPAHEYRLDAPGLNPKLIRVRTAVIGTRLYELSVTAVEADVVGKAADEFFESFTFREL